MPRRWIVLSARAAVVAMTGVLTLSACSNDNQKSLPDPVTNRYLTKQIVFTEPDGFRNVSLGCNGTTGVYVTSRGAYKNSGTDVASLPSSVTVQANDPYCTNQPVGGTTSVPRGVSY